MPLACFVYNLPILRTGVLYRNQGIAASLWQCQGVTAQRIGGIALDEGFGIVEETNNTALKRQNSICIMVNSGRRIRCRVDHKGGPCYIATGDCHFLDTIVEAVT